MMMTASLWSMEMLAPSGCVLFTTMLIVKFSAGSGSLSFTITILKQPELFLNKTVALTISKSFSAAVYDKKRTEVWKTQGYILLLQTVTTSVEPTYPLHYLNRHLKALFLYLIVDQVYVMHPQTWVEKTCYIFVWTKCVTLQRFHSCTAL